MTGTLKVMVKSTETIEREHGDTDVISLTLPSAIRFVRLARIAIASLARRKGMSVRSIDDLRLVIDETFSVLLGDTDHVGSVDVTFEVDSHELIVLVAQRFSTGAVAISDENRMHFEVVTADLVDRVEIDTTLGIVQFAKQF